MCDNRDDDYIQIMPGGNWHAQYKDTDGSIWTNPMPLVGWVLRRDGDICGMDADGTGWIGDAKGDKNFFAFVYISDPR